MIFDKGFFDNQVMHFRHSISKFHECLNEKSMESAHNYLIMASRELGSVQFESDLPCSEREDWEIAKRCTKIYSECCAEWANVKEEA